MTRVCRIVRIITYKIFLVEKKNQQKSSRGQKYSYIHAHALTTYYKIRYPKKKKNYLWDYGSPFNSGFGICNFKKDVHIN